jgi:hypothetical protein
VRISHGRSRSRAHRRPRGGDRSLRGDLGDDRTHPGGARGARAVHRATGSRGGGHDPGVGAARPTGLHAGADGELRGAVPGGSGPARGGAGRLLSALQRRDRIEVEQAAAGQVALDQSRELIRVREVELLALQECWRPRRRSSRRNWSRRARRRPASGRWSHANVGSTGARSRASTPASSISARFRDTWGAPRSGGGGTRARTCSPPTGRRCTRSPPGWSSGTRSGWVASGCTCGATTATSTTTRTWTRSTLAPASGHGSPRGAGRPQRLHRATLRARRPTCTSSCIRAAARHQPLPVAGRGLLLRRALDMRPAAGAGRGGPASGTPRSGGDEGAVGVIGEDAAPWAAVRPTPGGPHG